VLAVAGFTSGADVLAATAGAGPTKIAPHQVFVGEVNGTMETATVKVVCPVAATGGRAVSGQTISVTSLLVIPRNYGDTGAHGRAIAASIGPATSAAESIVLTKYNHPQPFPTNIDLPCSGTGIVVFAPVAGGHGSRPTTVTVTYENVGVSPRA
jgi:hypothetical protein